MVVSRDNYRDLAKVGVLVVVVVGVLVVVVVAR